MTITKLIDHPSRPLTFAFEDDGKTGYAYLHREDGKVCADVWLYNRSETPESPDWKDRTAAPYRNSAMYVRSDRTFALPETDGDIDVKWLEDKAEKSGAQVLLRGMVIGELYQDDMPGKSLMALRDGPLARVL